MAIIAVLAVTLVLSCIAISMSSAQKSSKGVDLRMKMLDDHEKRIRDFELRFSINSSYHGVNQIKDDIHMANYDYENLLQDFELELTRLLSSNVPEEVNQHGIGMLHEYEKRLQGIELQLIKLLSMNSSDDVNQGKISKLHDHEKRLQNIEEDLVRMLSNSTDEGNNDHIKRLHDHEKRLRDIELQLETPEILEIRPVEAFQISIFHPGLYLPSAAIDGNLNNFQHTERHINPWWCAKMDAEYHVTSVVITNRKNCCADRATNLRVGLTNTAPIVGQNLSLDAYSLCEEKPGLMGSVAFVSCPDDISGQYLVVQFRTENWMNIAEVKIYGFINQ